MHAKERGGEKGMKLSEALSMHLHASLAADEEVKKAFSAFLRNIPGRILQCEVDERSNQKQGIVKDESVYKFGFLPEKGIAFLEFFAHRNQGAPTMALTVDAQSPALTVRGITVEKQFCLQFTLEGGRVVKRVQME